MFRRSALLVAALAAAATVLVAAPAQAAAFGVSLSIDTTNADVGTSITLSGRVSGKGSASKVVTIQRKSGSSWKSVTTTRTSSKSTYRKAIKVPAAGTNQYRVVAPRAGRLTTGTSATRTVTGWTWLNLTEQPTAVEGAAYVGATVDVAGKRYPSSITFSYYTDRGYAGWWVDGLCDRSDIGFALETGAEGVLEVEAYDSYEGPRATRQVVEGARGRLDFLTPETEFLNYEWTFSDDVKVGDRRAGMLMPTPRAHCKVSKLPTFEQPAS